MFKDFLRIEGQFLQIDGSRIDALGLRTLVFNSCQCRAAGRIFPVGVFRGTWCHNELRYAISQGVRIREVHATMYSEDSVSPFTGYVTDLWQRREELKAQGSPRQAVYKLLLNSLAGKFGQRTDGALRELETMDAYWKHGPVKGTEVMVLRRMAYAKVPVPTTHIPGYIIVPWAAYITAYARIALHKAMLEVRGPILYVDTDSIMCFDDLPTGDDMGSLNYKQKELSWI